MYVHTYVYLFIVVRLLNRQTISKGTASVPLPRVTPVERWPRPIPLVDRSQTDRAHADNLHGDRLPAGNAAANEPMCPDARYIKARVDALRGRAMHECIYGMHRSGSSKSRFETKSSVPAKSNVPVAQSQICRLNCERM